jgi:phospholipase C
MESYSPDQVPVLSQLAQNFAVCDRWFGAAPAQTWPNRGFMHAGTARGQVSNSGPQAYNTETIFEVLQKTGHSWGIYNNNTVIPSLSKLMYPRLGLFPTRFHGFGQFKKDAHNGTLPSYSFVEPSFTIEPDDQHPPHNVADGERFLADVWTAVSTGAHWEQTLLVITYDEHGGCYDHVPPPWGAASPDAESDGIAGSPFNRFGVRVPAVVISPFIEPGTVFRSPIDTPFDHTSVLATLRDWLAIPSGAMLPSLRVAAAPTLEFLLTRTEARATLPDISAAAPTVGIIAAPPQGALGAVGPIPATPLNDLQFSMVVAVERTRQQRELLPAEIDDLRQEVPTTAHMVQFFKDRGLAEA